MPKPRPAPPVLWWRMRYHKAVQITEQQADLIRAMPVSSLSEYVVISQAGKWYDVRRMTGKELEAFVDDLGRAEIAAQHAKSRLSN